MTTASTETAQALETDMAQKTNNAPEVFWQDFMLACGTRRYRLFVDGTQTKYFVDRASHRAHFAYGDRCGLWGAGMDKSGCAGYLGGGSATTPLKHKAEQLAFGVN